MIHQRNPDRGFLISVNLDPPIEVYFQYNPVQLTDKRSVSYATLDGPGLIMPVRQYTQGGDRTFSFNVRVDGVHQGPAEDEFPIARSEDGSIAPELNKYRAFLYPQTDRWNQARGSFVQATPSLYPSSQVFASPPVCLFGFGESRVLECIVMEVNITETLFTAQLAPLRADISVTLIELSPYGNEPISPPGG